MAYVEKVCHIFRYVFISINKTSRLGPLYFAEVGVLMKKINKKIFKRNWNRQSARCHAILR